MPAPQMNCFTGSLSTSAELPDESLEEVGSIGERAGAMARTHILPSRTGLLTTRFLFATGTSPWQTLRARYEIHPEAASQPSTCLNTTGVQPTPPMPDCLTDCTTGT